MHLTRTLSKLLLPAAALAFAVAPDAADAAVSCAPGAGGAIDVTFSAAGDSTTIKRSGEKITIAGCPGSTSDVTAIDAIRVVDTSAGKTDVVVDLGGGPIGPGLTPEGTGTSAIEIDLDLGAGTTDRLTVRGTDGAEVLAAGALTVGGFGTDLDDDQDADITAVGVEMSSWEVLGGADEVVLSGPAGVGFTGPLPVAAKVYSGNGDDLVEGGSASDDFDDVGGDDVLVGGAGEDKIRPGTGIDQIQGGPGEFDSVNYAGMTSAVKVDFNLASEQATGGGGTDTFSGIESATGTAHADELIGTGGAEYLYGFHGADRIEPRGGDDGVYGGDGADTVDYSVGASGPVVVSLATKLAEGGAGKDTIFHTEHVTGSPFGDTIEGDGTANTLDGGLGADLLQGLGGDDTLKATDLVADTLECGEGSDVATADHAGLDTVADCENVERAAVPQEIPPKAAQDDTSVIVTDAGAAAVPPVAEQPAAPSTTPPPVLPVHSAPTPASLPLRLVVKARTKQRAGGGVAVTVTCLDSACSLAAGGRVTLRTGKGRAAKTLKLRAARTSLAAGRSGRIVLKVSPKIARQIRAALRHGGRATVAVNVAGSAAGAPAVKAVATVRLIA